MIGTLIGIFFAIIVIGVIWWGVLKLWPLVARYIAEPFATIAYVVLVIIFVLIVLYVIIQLLAVAGIHVPMLR